MFYGLFTLWVSTLCSMALGLGSFEILFIGGSLALPQDLWLFEYLVIFISVLIRSLPLKHYFTVERWICLCQFVISILVEWGDYKHWGKESKVLL